MKQVIPNNSKKSVALTKSQLANLRARCSKYPTMVEASIKEGVGRETLLRTIEVGRCNPETFNKLFSNQ